MKIAILGFGKEGQSVFNFLKRTKKFRNDEIWILDQNPDAKVPRDVSFSVGRGAFRILLPSFDLAFRSPGIPYNLPELRRARRTGTKFSSATKLFFEVINHFPPSTLHAPIIIGITGTKGKGTTATILYNILKKAGERVFLAGNIGTSALDILPELESGVRGQGSGKKTFVILELSSFQLQDLDVSPPIAVVTDVFPDHQDSHKNLAEYYGAKAHIARRQKKSDTIFFFAQSRESRRIGEKSPGKKIPVDPYAPYSAELGDKIRNAIRIPGEHNFKNAAMAATVARHLGAPESVIIKTIASFRGMEHRLEFVKKIMVLPIRRAQGKNKSAIYFYNDSASTNPHTAAAAIKAFQGQGSGVMGHGSGVRGQGEKKKWVKKSVTHDSCPSTQILIAGGQDKNLNYAPLARALKNSNTKLVVLVGENKNKINKAIRGQGSRVKGQVKIQFAKNFEEAVHRAYRSVVTHDPCPMTHIIFSPGAASFDMFKNYADRGKKFKKIVLGLNPNHRRLTKK